MQVTRIESRSSRLVLLAGILAVSMLLPVGAVAAAPSNASSSSAAGKQIQIMDPFGLEMVLVRAAPAVIGPGKPVRSVERPAGVNIPARPQARSPFVPPGSWHPGSAPWTQK